MFNTDNDTWQMKNAIDKDINDTRYATKDMRSCSKYTYIYTKNDTEEGFMYIFK